MKQSNTSKIAFGCLCELCSQRCKFNRLVRLLLRYMQKHPQAKHTAEGIARWWIMQQKLEEEVEVIEEVIDYLTDVGVMEKVPLPEDNAYYKFHPENVDDKLGMVDELMNENEKSQYL